MSGIEGVRLFADNEWGVWSENPGVSRKPHRAFPEPVAAALVAVAEAARNACLYLGPDSDVYRHLKASLDTLAASQGMRT